VTSPFALPTQASRAVIQLLKGVLYADQQPELWQALLSFRAAVGDYLAVIGLRVIVDEAEGYAYLRQAAEPEGEEAEAARPRLVQRRPLSYPVSLLLVWLRKRLAELDAAGGETRLVLTRAQIVDAMRLYLPEATNEAKTVEQIERHVNRVVEYGFLKPLQGDEERYEVRRILKALVDAEWLGRLDEKLAEYQSRADAAA
jgi:hypothetical protein